MSEDLLTRVQKAVVAKHFELYGCSCEVHTERKPERNGVMHPLRFVFACGRR